MTIRWKLRYFLAAIQTMLFSFFDFGELLALLEDFLLFFAGGYFSFQRPQRKKETKKTTTNYGARGGAAVELFCCAIDLFFRTRVVFKFIIFKKYFIYYDWRWSSPQVFFF
jgi:hypothetical protein